MVRAPSGRRWSMTRRAESLRVGTDWTWRSPSVRAARRLFNPAFTTSPPAGHKIGTARRHSLHSQRLSLAVTDVTRPKGVDTARFPTTIRRLRTGLGLLNHLLCGPSFSLLRADPFPQPPADVRT